MTVQTKGGSLGEKVGDYAKLAQLAYAEWIQDGDKRVLKPEQKDYRRFQHLWKEISKEEKGYCIVDHKPMDPKGFSATIFRKEGLNILAIRGSKDYTGFFADGAYVIDNHLPSEQVDSMKQYVAEHKLDEGRFDVTGHALGGFLALEAKETFIGAVQQVYTYNAPGAKGSSQCTYCWLDDYGRVICELK